MKQLALISHFLAMFGITWMVCMRATDWGTDRWDRTARWAPLVFGGLAWAVALKLLGDAIYPGDANRSDEMTVALVAGLPAAIAAYALLAKLRPGTAGARPPAPSEPVVIPEGGPKTKGEWLLLDIRAIPLLLRRRRK